MKTIEMVAMQAIAVGVYSIAIGADLIPPPDGWAAGATVLALGMVVGVFCGFADERDRP